MTPPYNSSSEGRETAQDHTDRHQLSSPCRVHFWTLGGSPIPHTHCQRLCGWPPRRGHLQGPGAPPGWLWYTLVQRGPGLVGQTDVRGPFLLGCRKPHGPTTHLWEPFLVRSWSLQQGLKGKRTSPGPLYPGNTTLLCPTLNDLASLALK